jgi:hypothetical protein
MESEPTKRLNKAVKHRILYEKLDTIRLEQFEIYSKINELMKINFDMIQLVTYPIKKSA